jgi:hypothetical protein
MEEGARGFFLVVGLAFSFSINEPFTHSFIAHKKKGPLSPPSHCWVISYFCKEPVGRIFSRKHGSHLTLHSIKFMRLKPRMAPYA